MVGVEVEVRVIQLFSGVYLLFLDILLFFSLHVLYKILVGSHSELERFGSR